LQIDSYLGELPDTIDELGIAGNTIFIFTADNGPEALDFGSTQMTFETAAHGSPGPWRGSLFTGFEGALRVPFAIRWPGKIAAEQSSDEIVHAMDLFPTLAKLAGGNVPHERPIDGLDMADFFLGESEKSGRDGFIVYMGNDVFGVKWQNWKRLRAPLKFVLNTRPLWGKYQTAATCTYSRQESAKSSSSTS
jgi:arylsulfatase